MYKKLFTKFERFEEKNTTVEDTGLGLAITKRLLELMHGKIVCQSVYGKGSKFTVAIDQRIVNKEVSELENTINVFEDLDLNDKRVTHSGAYKTIGMNIEDFNNKNLDHNTVWLNKEDLRTMLSTTSVTGRKNRKKGSKILQDNIQSLERNIEAMIDIDNNDTLSTQIKDNLGKYTISG